jgi:hypothetical protein
MKKQSYSWWVPFIGWPILIAFGILMAWVAAWFISVLPWPSR